MGRLDQRVRGTRVPFMAALSERGLGGAAAQRTKYNSTKERILRLYSQIKKDGVIARVTKQYTMEILTISLFSNIINDTSKK